MPEVRFKIAFKRRASHSISRTREDSSRQTV